MMKKIFFLLIAVCLSGCAYKPAGEKLDEEQLEAMVPILQKQLVQQQENCPASWDADLIASVQSSGDKQKFEGYLRVQEPSSIKFIVSNPLGQPIMVLTTNGDYFRLLNAAKKQFIRGSNLSYALHTDIPRQFVSGNWGLWLGGRLPDISFNHLIKSTEGLWIRHKTEDGVHYYLWDTDNKRISRHLLLDKKEKILATINYNYTDFVNKECQQPSAIDISDLPGLPFSNSQIQMKLGQVKPAPAMNEKDMLLKAPQHYTVKLMP